MHVRTRLAGLAALLLVAASAAAQPTFEQRFFRYDGNFIFDATEDSLTAYIDRAATVGYTGVLVSDPKVNRWWEQGFGADWQRRVAAVRDHARSKGLTFVFSAFPLGYGQPIALYEPSLASGTPVEAAPLVATETRLVPQPTATLANGGFEASSDGVRADGWDFQDVPGVAVVPGAGRDGSAALRVDASATEAPNKQGRALQRIDVEPFQQYRLRVWIKMEDYTTDRILPLVLDDADGRNLGTLFFSDPAPEGRRRHFRTAQGRSQDWTEYQVIFNSLDATRIRLFLGTWGNESGTLWWDDVRLDAVPSYNVVRRDELPVTVTSADGAVTYVEGVDYGRVEDPPAERTPINATHPAPEIVRLPGSAIPVGATVLYSGYSVVLVQRGQTSVSWNSSATLDLARTLFRNAGGPDATDRVGADGYLVNYDEIRTGGWEPASRAIGTPGQALAASIAERDAAMRAETGAASYQWSDMFDPYHNAVEDFYAIGGDLRGSWDGLDPTTTVFNWWSGDKLRSETATRSLVHFDSLGVPQIVAGYYDEDVAGNRDAWFAALAAANVDNVVGAMYTTYANDWSDLEAFAEAWWNSEPYVPPTAGDATGEAGTARLARTASQPGQRVDFEAAYADPIVILGPPSANGGDPVTVRASDLDGGGFTLSLVEYPYLDGPHTTESVGWAAIERGVHTVRGSLVEATSVEAGGAAWVRVAFAAPFAEAPVVLASAASQNDARAAAVRIRNVTASGAEIRLQTQETDTGSLAPETIHVVAVAPTSGAGFAVGRTADAVTDAWAPLAWDAIEAPILLASMQTTDGGDTAALRHRALGATGAQVRVEEETSRDAETRHTTEVVGWAALAPGHVEASHDAAPALVDDATEAPVALALTSAPNPVRDRATLTYALPDAGDVRLAVYDLLGRSVAQLADGPAEAGTHHADLDARDLAPGVYVVRLEAATGSETLRVTVVR